MKKLNEMGVTELYNYLKETLDSKTFNEIYGNFNKCDCCPEKENCEYVGNEYKCDLEIEDLIERN